jgi:hypothetical protein
MKKFAILLSAIGIAVAAPLAGANEDGLDLMPSRIEGVEITHFVRDLGTPGTDTADAFYARGTSGVSPQ